MKVLACLSLSLVYYYKAAAVFLSSPRSCSALTPQLSSSNVRRTASLSPPQASSGLSTLAPRDFTRPLAAVSGKRGGRRVRRGGRPLGPGIIAPAALMAASSSDSPEAVPRPCALSRICTEARRRSNKLDNRSARTPLYELASGRGSERCCCCRCSGRAPVDNKRGRSDASTPRQRQVYARARGERGRPRLTLLSLSLGRPSISPLFAFYGPPARSALSNGAVLLAASAA